MIHYYVKKGTQIFFLSIFLYQSLYHITFTIQFGIISTGVLKIICIKKYFLNYF